ncbi:FAD-binding oxidoreductase [Nocardioides massiliensis]|uniref:Delta(24)-sterol reductase n=1 Tax=Nocardioides massiliensis TaxID=1325935 RepID=A0ABT9NPT5_9ACTN|nr:FAD-binding oxidoreductase [Nocardioides massiliensis]MDP9822430.1 FAD/FMN-containing dehydrogenase [Nocardioides massiliensis]
MRGRGLVGAAAHEVGVRRLQDSFAAIPPGQPVRLAKRTSNLFRPRGQLSTPGLDVSGLDGVVSVDVPRRTADVQGMCTYEDLVAATLPHGLMPLVVPQLRTITLGGAVTGLGIESTSFRNGLPHESVLEMDVLVGSGEVVTTSPDRKPELFAAFPNSYGSLGYATRLRIELEQVPTHVALRHVRFGDRSALAEAIAAICDERTYDGVRVDAVDGTVFARDEAYLTLATWTARPAGTPTSDYGGQQIYYRSIRERTEDLLTTEDYLWRWDTDWFWCSGAFGAQHPLVRRVWPRRWRRSDVYHRLVGWDRRLGIVDRIDQARKRPARERVIQDVEVPVEWLGEFLDWFDDHVAMTPVWVCPLRLREPDGPGSARHWPAYPLDPGRTYVNIGFWGTVPVGPGARDGVINRAVEEKVHALGGHKSLYSEAFYDPATFATLYGTATLDAVRATYDPDDRFTTLYEKAVRRR